MLMFASIQAANNNIKLNFGIPRLTTVEYERKLPIPGLNVFVNYGTGKISWKSRKTTISGLATGVRYKIPILGYLGIGFESLKVNYSYTQKIAAKNINISDIVKVDGKLNGLLIEYGTGFKIGPVMIGGNIGYIKGTPKVTSAKVGSVDVNKDGVNSGIATVKFIPQFGFYLGFAF